MSRTPDEVAAVEEEEIDDPSVEKDMELVSYGGM